MDRLKRKELQLLKQQKQQKKNQHKNALRTMIKNEENIQIILKYAEQYLKNNNIDKLSQYSPIQISRLVFDTQLKLIKEQFQKLPDRQVYIQHFIVIMLKVMKFPFEKCPLYMVGLKDMFYQIAEQGKQTINYHAFFKYILGQLVTMKEEQQNTQFQVQILQRKKQDYLLHDNGIKRIYYSKDMKMIFSLDERANSVKIYDQEMKNINKFSPKKQKHSNKFPIILDFDYSEITQRLGLVLSDQTLSTVQLANFLNKTPSEFQAYAMNQIVFQLPQKMRRIFFIQMMNKWLTVSEQGNKIYLFDMDRMHSQPQKIMSRLKIDLNDQKISQILEIVVLSCVCIVAGNQVSFYNQNFTEVIFKKFVHCEQIKHFKYSDQKNQFYVCGFEKNITIFSISRSGNPSNIHIFPTNRPITDFQLFPYFDTIVIADENNDIKLMHESTKAIYQQLSYSHIVKAKDKTINISKISKNEFAIYQTYMIVMVQQKIAIQKDIQYSYLPYYYYDQQKQELYLSVNNQIISFSLLSGQIRKNYSIDSSNLQKHHSFFIKHKCPLFILDHEFNIYEVYQKDEVIEGQNRNYKKKINIQQAINCFYDQSLNTMIIINKDSITQVRNDKNNHFNNLNTINLQGFPNIIMSLFCEESKKITFLAADQLIYQFKNYNHKIDHCYRFVFPKDYTDHQERFIIKFHYDHHFDIFILFSNKNQLYFISGVTNQQIYFNITEHMPTKLKNLKFISFNFQLVNEKKGYRQPYIIAYDETGFLIQFSLEKIFQQYNFQINLQHIQLKTMFKETQIMAHQNIEIVQICLSQSNKLKKTYAQIGLMRTHEKQIALAMRLKVQILTTLTISIDGYIRLWNDKYTLLFSLKIPSLLKVTWNMKQIQSIKNRKSIDQLLKIYDNSYYDALQQHCSPIQTWNKSKRLKNKQQITKVNYNDPIKLEIENKDIEEIVMHKQDYRTFYSTNAKYKTHGLLNTTSKIYPHPWRKKKQFLKIFQKATSPTKYKEKIPQNLVQLRNSLDMTQKIRQALDYKEAEQLLPQLSVYQPEKNLSDKKKNQTIQNQEEGETFESCLYVKTQRRKKKINQFDEIDKQFKKKEMLLTARKWIPTKRKQRNTSLAELKSQIGGYTAQGKVDPLKAIQRIFQAHNKECLDHKKGRLIRIPKIHINKDIY